MIDPAGSHILAFGFEETIRGQTTEIETHHVMERDEDFVRVFTRDAQRIVRDVLMHVVCVDDIRTNLRDFPVEHLRNCRNPQAVIMPQRLAIRCGDAYDMSSPDEIGRASWREEGRSR